MDYGHRRRSAKLQEWYICKELGINHNEWVEISTGRKNLANDKLDKFIKLTDLKNKEYINQNNELDKIDEWYNKTDVVEFKKLMNDFKVTQTEIAKIIGYDKATICRTMNKKGISDGCKCALYYYFNDENNRRNQWVINRAKTLKPKIKEKEKLNEGVTTSISAPLDTNVLANAYGIPPVPNSIIFGLKHRNDDKEPVGVSFVKKEDYDKVIKEKNEIKEELERYKFLIDQIRNA